MHGRNPVVRLHLERSLSDVEFQRVAEVTEHSSSSLNIRCVERKGIGSRWDGRGGSMVFQSSQQRKEGTDLLIGRGGDECKRLLQCHKTLGPPAKMNEDRRLGAFLEKGPKTAAEPLLSETKQTSFPPPHPFPRSLEILCVTLIHIVFSSPKHFHPR